LTKAGVRRLRVSKRVPECATDAVRDHSTPQLRRSRGSARICRRATSASLSSLRCSTSKPRERSQRAVGHRANEPNVEGVVQSSTRQTPRRMTLMTQRTQESRHRLVSPSNVAVFHLRAFRRTGTSLPIARSGTGAPSNGANDETDRKPATSQVAFFETKPPASVRTRRSQPPRTRKI
jgi:hypothetical protein